MTNLSFELTMPNVGSWNGKWTGATRKYYIIRKFLKKDESKITEMLKDGSYYYNFGDGWGANVAVEKITSKEASRRMKLSSGFAGYDWMVRSIIENGTIQI